MKRLLVLLLLLACGGATALEGYSTPREAAVAALTAAARVPYYEFGNVVVRLVNGRYDFVTPHTLLAGNQSRINLDPDAYSGVQIVATYHTHPCIKGYLSDHFSPPDLSTTRAVGKPAYIADLCTGDVHVFDPRIDTVARTVINFPPDTPTEIQDLLRGQLQRQDSPGRIVGRIPVTGAVINVDATDEGPSTNALRQGSLPHRKTGLDPQGHLPIGKNPHGPLCPGQYEYRDGDGFLLFCWGKK
ncbi:MAG TPA: hypothetical protein VGU20_30885 [Stellaceae bacterium]|nr:hypothetical protein [Terriglobia bacterium]HEV2551756.1 hypothetical protein [Stellaceae bacterium]